MMGNSVEHGGCHFFVNKDLCPFTEAEIGVLSKIFQEIEGDLFLDELRLQAHKIVVLSKIAAVGYNS